MQNLSGIKSIKIKNLLSFNELFINDLKDVNCIVGINNTGKSNLLKLLKYFYNRLENIKELPPSLNSKYSAFGTITITFNLTRIKQIVEADSKIKKAYFKYIYNVLFKDREELNFFSDLANNRINDSTLDLTLTIFSNDSVEWSIKDKKVLELISYLYPFFHIETRHIDLYDWNKIWNLISRLKSFNLDNFDKEKIITFFDKQIDGEESNGSNGYREYINKIERITNIGRYSYREKVLNYIKVGLTGQTFTIDNKDLSIQSDGTNSHKFIELFLDLLISLTRREYISPTVYIDEPEIGLHPKKNEELIYNLFDIYNSFKKTTNIRERGKYKTPYPTIIFSTHSPNIVKQIIKLFDTNQQILHFSKNKSDHTIVQKMNSHYDDKRFLPIFSDNEARLFFSNFILFVEGETELEIFNNKSLMNKFSILKKIDIYKSSSNVFSANINPASANTSIPYLFLFDADKIFSFQNINTSNCTLALQLLNKNDTLYNLPNNKPESKKIFENDIKKYSKGHNDKYRNLLKNLKEVMEIKDQIFTYNKLSYKINEQRVYLKCLQILRKYLVEHNVFFVNSTIEEILINKKSSELFISWLIKEYQIDTSHLYNIRNVEYTLSFYKQRIGIGHIIYCNPRKKIKKSIEYKHLKYPIDLFVDYIRVYFFNGKFETLISGTKGFDSENKSLINEYHNLKNQLNKQIENYGNVTGAQKIKINTILDTFMRVPAEDNSDKKTILEILKKLKIKTSKKTSTWATSFLNFAIDEIDKNKDNRSFEDEFKKYFEELYDIITSIRRKT